MRIVLVEHLMQKPRSQKRKQKKIKQKSIKIDNPFIRLGKTLKGIQPYRIIKKNEKKGESSEQHRT